MERSMYSNLFASRMPFMDALLYLTFKGDAWSFYSDLSWWRRWWVSRTCSMVEVLSGNHFFRGYMYRGALYITKIRDADSKFKYYGVGD